MNTIRSAATPLLAAAIGFAITGAPPATAAEPVTFDSPVTYRVVDPTIEINRKQLVLLELRESDRLMTHRFVLGADLQVIADAQSTNTETKFGYLMRHPTANNHSGDSISEMVIHDANVSIIGTPNDWTTLYLQMLYNPQQSFGSGTIVDIERNQLSLRRGYVLIGDLAMCPFYVSLGKMATPFGLTDTVNPFSASTVWHVFGGLAYGGQLGFHAGMFDLAVMGIQGGAQFRAAHSGDETPDDVTNFTAAGAVTVPLTRGGSLRLGGGYLYGSAYCQDWPVRHFESCNGFHNPAWNAHALVKWGPFTLLGEYTETTDEWPGTFNPHPPLDIYPASKVSAFDIGGKVDVPFGAIGRDIGVSVDFSQFTAGAEGSPWEEQSQLVVGFDVMLNAHTKWFAEYIHTDGYVPLNFLSGPDPSDPSEDPGTTHSDAFAESDVGLVGIRVAI